MLVRVVVADQSEARFYDTDHHAGPLTLVRQMSDQSARLHDRDFKSDRPGRIFNHVPGSKRRGSVVHHGVGGESTPRKHEADLFARQIAEALELEHREAHFDRVILVAGPPFLGVLRQALSHSFHARIAAEIPKDLVHESPGHLLQYLPHEAFYSR